MVRPLIQVGDAVHRATMKIQHDATQELGQLDLNKRRFPPALWFFPIQSDIDRIQGTEWKYVKIDSDTLDKQTTTEKTSTNSKIDSREKQIALGQATYLISDALEDIYDAMPTAQKASVKARTKDLIADKKAKRTAYEATL